MSNQEFDGEGGMYGNGAGESGRARMAGGIAKEADSVVEELVRLKEWKEQMENT